MRAEATLPVSQTISSSRTATMRYADCLTPLSQFQ